jgi:Icc protein
VTGDVPGPVFARLSRPRSPQQIRLAVIADPHVTDGSGTWKVKHRSQELFARAVEQATAADVTVLAGDLTGDGRRESFAAVDDCLADLGGPRLTVPGNHDVPKSFDAHQSPPAATFEARYTDLPAVTDVGPVTLVGVNTASAPDGALRDTWGGRVGERDRGWLARRLPEIDVPIVVLHHNVASLPENPGGKWLNFPLQDAADVRELLTVHDVPLVVTGHHHVPTVVEHGATTELLSPAVCSYPQAMLDVVVGPEGTVIRLVPLATASELREARRLAATGKPLGAGVLELVESELQRIPHVDSDAG